MSKPVIAIMYDFDKTLCTNDMQNYSFIPSLGMSINDFWGEANKLAENEHMDRLLAYMYLMLKKAKSVDIAVTRENFVELGRKIELFNGVEGWFERINEYGRRNGAIVEHYVISSGLKEIIEGSPVFGCFKKVYACEFLYDVNNVAVWPKNVVNFTTKTQFLFRVNKGELEISEDEKLNTFIPGNERRVPFRNMIYIGDGLTDVPCMKLVKVNGGQSVAVYNKRKKETASKLLDESRVDYIAKADYTDGSQLDKVIKRIIDKMVVTDELAKLHDKQMEQNKIPH